MKQIDFLIVGGSAAGTTAAETIRNNLPNSTITIVTDEDHEQYSRVLLPHYIRGKVGRDQVFLKKGDWYKDKNIELLRGLRAEGLDVSKKQVKLSNGELYQYGKLLIAIGGKVIKLNVPGAREAKPLYMRTVEDADRIIAEAKGAKSAVIIGGGFIGLEFTSCFKVNGLESVTVLVMEPYYWAGKLDEQSSKVLVSTLEKNGVEVLTSEEIDRFEPVDTPKPIAGFHPVGAAGTVRTKSGKEIEADVIGVGVGIKGDLSWFNGSGIKINRGIVTNEFLETNLPDVYAAGDCAEFHDVIFERQHIMGNWANATSQGNAVGKTMSGQRTVFETASSYSINFFDGSCSFIGVTDEKFADEVVSRGSVEEGKMTRIFVKNPGGVVRIVGATIINSVADVSPLTMAVKGKIDVAKYKDQLSKVNFDLKELIS